MRLPAALVTGLVVFSTRIWLCDVWGSPIPYLDEWDANAGLLRAWLDGSFSWDDLIAPHNEHRIALTRAANLALFTLSGEWNIWHQLALNAILHAGTADTS